MFLDPIYFFYPLPALSVWLWAWQTLRKARKGANTCIPNDGPTGAELAWRFVRSQADRGVRVLEIDGSLTDLYDPEHQELRLASPTSQGRSLWSLALAAHESGHAIESSETQPLARIRSFLVPLALYGSSLFWLILFASVVLWNVPFFLSSLGLLTVNVVVQCLNLVLEDRANRRLRERLPEILSLNDVEARCFKRAIDATSLRLLVSTITWPFEATIKFWPQRLFK